MINVWQAMLFMAIGAALMGAANWFNWKKYYEGKREEQDRLSYVRRQGGK